MPAPISEARTHLAAILREHLTRLAEASPPIPWRPLTDHEQSIGFAETAQQVDAHMAQAGTAIAEATQTVIRNLRAKVARLTITAKAVRDLDVTAKDRTMLRKVIEQVLSEGYATGQQTVGREIRRGVHAVKLSEDAAAVLELAERGGLVGSKAQSYFQSKAFWVTDLLLTDVLKRAQGVLFNSLKQDKTSGQTLYELDQALGDYLPETNAAGQIVNVPARIETIARTNLADAVNEGRWAAASDPDMQGYVNTARYSAVLDSRTRENHRAWDGVTLPMNHPAWFGPPDERPPNGFNCRCILVFGNDASMDITPDDEIPTVPAADPSFK